MAGSSLLLVLALSIEASLAILAYWLNPLLTGRTLASRLSLESLPTTVTLGVLAGLLAVGAVGVAFASLPRYSRALYKDVIRQLEQLHPAVLSLAGVAAALGEELFFRGLLQPWLGLWPASALFGLLHVSGRNSWLYYGLTAALLGLGLGVMYEATGNLVGPIVAHALYNITVTFLIARGTFHLGLED